MTQQAQARRSSSPVQRGRLALASALAAFTLLGGAAFADDLTPAPEISVVDEIAFDLPTDVVAPAVLKREKEQRGNDDGAAHARKGADDPSGDDRGKDRRVGRHGADDPAGDDHGKDRRVSRKGADDQPGDDRGGHGHGQDDAPNHG